MGTILASDIGTRAKTILQDSAGVRWTDTELLRWVNDGQREIVAMLPSAFTKATVATLAAGTRQTATALGLTDCVQVVRLTRNYAADGSTVGGAISVCDMAWLDRELPDWHQTSAASEAKHYMVNAQEPKTAWIYPPVTAGLKVEVIYHATPPDVAAIGNAIALDDIYANPLGYYVLFRALSKRLKNNATAKQDAVGYYTMMANLLGVKLKNQVQTTGEAQ